MKTKSIRALVVLLSFVGLAGCAGSVSEPEGTGGPLGIDPKTGLPILGDDDAPAGRSYKAFGGGTLGSDRISGAAGEEMKRVKPYSALVGEYARVLGKTPALLPTFAATFSEPPARWFFEPEASAVSVFSAYRAAFQGCLDLTATDAAYATAPTPTTAATECGKFASRFWTRTAGSAEIDVCVNVATVQTQPETDFRRKWAYTCAAVLTSAGFLSF